MRSLPHHARLLTPMNTAVPLQVLTDILDLNPHLDRAELLAGATDVDDRNCSVGDWDLGGMGIKALPKSIGTVTVDGQMNLSQNEMTRLPSEITDMRIAGSLDFTANELEM